jgi:hypothetical protein
MMFPYDPPIHILKTWPDPFQAVWDGAKTAEFCRDDRGGFAVGHALDLREWDHDGSGWTGTPGFTGRRVLARVTDVRRGPEGGIPAGHALLSIRPEWRGHTDCCVGEVRVG